MWILKPCRSENSRRSGLQHSETPYTKLFNSKKFLCFQHMLEIKSNKNRHVLELCQQPGLSFLVFEAHADHEAQSGSGRVNMDHQN